MPLVIRRLRRAGGVAEARSRRPARAGGVRMFGSSARLIVALLAFAVLWQAIILSAAIMLSECFMEG